MNRLLFISTFVVFALSSALAGGPDSKRNPLGAYLGHWESSSKFFDTKFSKAQTVTSSLDCSWSPQGVYLVCEQLIHDADGQHTQLTIYEPNAKDSGFSFYTFNTPGQEPYVGSLKIEGTIWTYGPSQDAVNTYPLFRTTNVIENGSVTFKVEVAEEPSHWITIGEGSTHRVSK